MIDTKYKQYALDIVNNNIVACEYIKLACHRFLNWFDRDDIYFNSDKVDKVINFISKLKHYTGKHNGKAFKLQAWQEFIVANIFGWYWKETNKRVTKKVYIEVARKNGKSALISAIALYCLIADGENGAEVDVAANSRQQGKILFDMASNFIQGLDPSHKHFKPYRDKIKFDYTKSYLQVFAADATKLDGFNASCFCLDELHEAKDSKLYDVLVSSQGMRENPLSICITSAGFNLFSFCYGMRNICIEILHGVKEDDSQFSMIYALDEDDDYTDSNNWIKSNPNLDITVTSEYLKEQVVSARNNKTLEVGVLTKNFGRWCKTNDIWINNDILLKSSQKLDISFFTGYNVTMGVDLSAVSDLTAVSLCCELDDKYYFKTWYFLPESALVDNSNSELYKDWKNKGLLHITAGNVVDYDYILSIILKINQDINIDKIAYDAWNATQWAINATAEGLPLEPFSQALWHFNRATKGFERLIKSGKIIIDDNEITRYCFSNVTLKFDHNENCKPVKTERQQKIDGVISMLQSLGAMIEVPQYDNQIIPI
jgi:phage terminase large subunit-like protein